MRRPPPDPDNPTGATHAVDPRGLDPRGLDPRALDPRGGRRVRADERGSSLIEVLVAMSIMALVLMGIFAGYEMTVTASTSAKDRSAADAALSTMIERVQGLPYRPCGSLAAIRQDFAALPRPAGVTATLDSVGYLRAVDAVNGTNGTFGAGCTVDRGAQLVHVTVTATAGGTVAVSGEAVLRDPKATP